MIAIFIKLDVLLEHITVRTHSEYTPSMSLCKRFDYTNCSNPTSFSTVHNDPRLHCPNYIYEFIL